MLLAGCVKTKKELKLATRQAGRNKLHRNYFFNRPIFFSLLPRNIMNSPSMVSFNKSVKPGFTSKFILCWNGRLFYRHSKIHEILVRRHNSCLVFPYSIKFILCLAKRCWKPYVYVILFECCLFCLCECNYSDIKYVVLT